MAALVVTQAARLGDRTVPDADWAFIELDVQRAAHARLALGPYSRFGWYHPGPAMSYVLAPFYVVGGHRFAALTFGAAVLALALVAAVLLVAGRVWGPWGRWAAAAVLVVFQWRFGVERLRDPWNPYMVILPVALLLLLVPLVAHGRQRWPLALGVAAASYAVQTHVSSVPVVAAAAVAIVLALVLDVRRKGLRALARRCWPALGVAAVAWALPVWEQVSHETGNLGLLLQYVRTDHGSLHPVGDAIRPAVLALGLGPTPVGKRFGVDSPFLAPLRLTATAVAVTVLLGAVLVVLLVLTGRRHDTRLAWMLAAAALGLAMFVYSVRRTEDELWPYLFVSIVGLSLALWIAAAASATTLLEPANMRPLAHHPPWTAPLAAALLAVGALTLTWSGLSASTDGLAARFSRPEVTALVAGLGPVCSGPEQDVTVRSTGDGWIVSLGVGAALGRCGKRVGFEGLPQPVWDRYGSRPRGLTMQLDPPTSAPPSGARRLATTGTFALDLVGP
jgi:hypothetical protein